MVRNWSSQGIRLILWLTLVLGAMPSLAAVKSYDYYGHDFLPGLLVNVEKYHLEPGRGKLQRGQYIYAMPDARFMLAYFPNDPNALKLAMNIALQWPGHEFDAKPLFAKAISSYPQHAETYVIYGVYLHRWGKLEDAVTEYKKAIARGPRLAEAHYNLGLALVAIGRLSEANDEAHKAYALGYPLPGLKSLLESHGAWQSTEDNAK